MTQESLTELEKGLEPEILEAIDETFKTEEKIHYYYNVLNF